MVAIFGSLGGRKKKTRQDDSHPKEAAPEEREDTMSRTTTSLSHGGPIPAATAKLSTEKALPSTPQRRRKGTNESYKSPKTRRRKGAHGRHSSRASTTSSRSSILSIDVTPRRLAPIAPVSPIGSDFGSIDNPSSLPKYKFKGLLAERNSSVENITALPRSHALKTSPHLRPATKDNADIPYDFRQTFAPSRLGTPTPLQELERHTAEPPKKRNLLSRQGSQQRMKPPHLANLPNKLSKKDSKRQPLRDEDIRVMMAPAHRPYTSGHGELLERESKTVRDGMNRRFGRPHSTISLPRPETTRPNTRMSALGVPRSASAAGGEMKSRSYRISVMDVVSPRPLIKVQENMPATIWGEDDDFDDFADNRPETAFTRLTFADLMGRKGKEKSHHRRIDDLADDMDASDLRLAMERDKRRKEKKKEREAEKLKRRLERRVEKDKEREEAGDHSTAGAEAPISSPERGRKSRRAGKEPIRVRKEREVDEKSLPPLPDEAPSIPPKEPLPGLIPAATELLDLSRPTTPIPSFARFRHDPDDDDLSPTTPPEPSTAEKPAKEEPREARDEELESHSSSPIQPMFPLQALPAIPDRKGAFESGRATANRQPNMSLGPLLATSTAAQDYGVESSFTALPQVPASPVKKTRTRGSTIFGLFRRTAGKNDAEVSKKQEKRELEKDKEKGNNRERRRSRAKSLLGAIALGGKKSPELDRDTRHDSFAPADLLAAAQSNTTTSGSLGRMFSKQKKSPKDFPFVIEGPIIPQSPSSDGPSGFLVTKYSDADLAPRPPTQSRAVQTPTAIKPSTPLRTQSIFKEHMGDINVDEGTYPALSGPFTLRSPAGEEELHFRSPTPPHGISPNPSVPTSDYLFPGPSSLAPPADDGSAITDPTELGAIGSEGGWLTGKPVKRRPSTRGSTGYPRTGAGSSVGRRSLSSSRYSQGTPETTPQARNTLVPVDVTPKNLRSHSNAGHETDDASQSAYYDAESKIDPSTQDEDSDDLGSPDADTTLTPRPRSRAKSWIRESGVSDKPDISTYDAGEWMSAEEKKKKEEETELKIYGSRLGMGKRPDVKPGVRVKSSEGMLKETLGFDTDVPPVPKVPTKQVN